MGLYRIYPTHPTFIPPNDSSLVNRTDAPTLDGERAESSDVHASTGFAPPDVDIDHIFDPFTNPTCGLMMTWRYTGTNDKSDAEVNRLSHFHQHPAFKLQDLLGFNCARESKLMDKYLQDKTNPLREEFGWRQSTVRIRLPKERQTWPSEKDAPELEVPGIYHRSIMSIIRSTFEDDIAKTFHMTPYSEYWKVSDTKTVQVFSEAYSSPAMLDAYAEINAFPREPDDDLERVLAPLMMWSDATHLASFGDASLWPFYLYFGNQSKYTRGKPTSFACHHLAYIPSVCFIFITVYMAVELYILQLPNNLQEIYVDIFDEATTDQVHTFLKRELVQAIWKLLLDGDFMHAYEHGVVIHCSDGITRRVFPRFFSYSADYPEKCV